MNGRRNRVRRVLWMVVLSALALGHLGSGCEPKCGDSCSSDEDCGGDLVCYSDQCAPRECRENCMEYGINICYFDRVTCDYLHCD
ncbi:hypothetical protein KBD49_04505 [Myxococcota bacterium]|jgi:hypothetical protein|nr:hypothetical protein [Myxococcota bacterium]